MSRKMVKLIHADGFFPNNDAQNLKNLADGLQFVEKPYGFEVPDFNLIFPDSESIFHKVLGERVTVDPKRSGVIRKPNNNAIHFEQYDSTEEWCFVVALEPTVINFWYHIDPKENMGELGTPDARHALEGTEFNYSNLFEWKIHTNIVLETNQALFFRPWVFHSLEDGLVQYYRLLADKQYRILVMGLPESSRKDIAHKLANRIGGNAAILDSNGLRHQFKDVDYTEDGQLRHCYRLLNLARGAKTPVTIINMTCPLPKMREILNPDILIWVSDAEKSNYIELNDMFVSPIMYDIECKDSSEETMNEILKRMMTKRI
jgi:hypothetical protein